MCITPLATGVVLAAVALLTLGGCGSSVGGSSTGRIAIVAAENEYGNVAEQIGGPYVSVTSVESNPNTDPHSYEVSPSVARSVADAQLVIQNGLGYDTYMERLEAASPHSARRVIDVQHLLDLPDSTPNPHLWYDPGTMPKVADALAADLSALAPAHAGAFRSNAATFIASLEPWTASIDSFKSAYPDTPVATTEPVADYLLQAAGAANLTPFSFQADVMNGVDPAPQDVTRQNNLLTEHRVKVLVYNEQVTDALTQSFITAARAAGIPVVGVYETMPSPGYTFQTWMEAEVHALEQAVAHGTSTAEL